MLEKGYGIEDYVLISCITCKYLVDETKLDTTIKDMSGRDYDILVVPMSIVKSARCSKAPRSVIV